MTVLYSAPPIPAGIQSFQWNPQESHWNKNGIKHTKVETLIYLSQFLKLPAIFTQCLLQYFTLKVQFQIALGL